jgi:hypothetical protein
VATSSRASTRPGRGFYTIGLAEQFGHPELVTAGVDLGHAAHVVEDMAEMIRHGARFEVGQTDLQVPYATVAIGRVHPVHVAGGLVNMWQALYTRRPDPPELDVVQVRIEPSLTQPRLDRAHTNLHVDRHRRRR